MKKFRTFMAALGVLMLATGTAAAEEQRAVLAHYAAMAHAVYADSLTTAQALQRAVDALIARPTEKNLASARKAWIAARVPYEQSEVFRFGNAVVDDWEGKVNAWPLDEGLIDYVATGYGSEADENPLYAANVVANRTLILSGRRIDVGTITKSLLADTLHEIGGIEANVATGYHAIEFLLWGQDLNGTGPGAGTRPAGDYDPKTCARGHCGRRAAYLRTATDLLVDDLAWMTAQWAPGGAARTGLVHGDPAAGLTAIVTGMGSLSYGELAGERMKLGLMLHDPEEEQDCFSDNTHNANYFNALGVRNVYTGAYRRVDGRLLQGPGISKLVAAAAPEIDRALRNSLDATMKAMRDIVRAAEGGEAFDQMLAAGNAAGNVRVQAGIDALTAQTKQIEKAVAALGLSQVRFAGSDSLDNPVAVFK